MSAAVVVMEPLRASATLSAFNPSDEDLFHYLKRRERHGGYHPGCPPSLVPEIDVYGELNPWEMFDKSAVDHWFYAFARLKQRGPKRFHRSVGRGSWTLKYSQKTNGGTNVKRFFVYEDSRADAAAAEVEDIGHWSMHEFSLSGVKDNDYVICRVKSQPHKQQTLPAENGNNNNNNNHNFIDLSAASDDDVDAEDDWEAILDEVMEEESDGEAAATAEESMVVESSGEVVDQIRAPGEIGDFGLESEEEVLAMVDNFWAEPPADIGEILCSGWWTTTFPVTDWREFAAST